VDALNRCWAPYHPDDPPMTPAAFKRSIRDLQVWCSSCMVAFSGSDPIGVLIGAKRPSGTLVHKIAVHPDHRRQGHGQHLLASLGSKLAILGPPKIVAEVPETLAPARELFSASGYVQETVLTDYVWRCEGQSDDVRRWLVIPVTVDDLAANGLLEEKQRHVCWQRSVETLTARKDEIAGLAVVTDERIEAYLLYVMPRSASAEATALRQAQGRPEHGRTVDNEADVLAARSFIDDGGARLKHLLSVMRARGIESLRFAKVHPDEMGKEWLENPGFRPAARHILYGATARSG
jgi:GNAT superfamily N-acetyltransferase